MNCQPEEIGHLNAVAVVYNIHTQTHKKKEEEMEGWDSNQLLAYCG